MESYEDELVHSFKSYKLDRSADEVLAELKNGNTESIIKLATSIFKVAGSSALGLPSVPSMISSLLNAYNTIQGVSQFYNIKKHIMLFVRLDEITKKNRADLVGDLEKDVNFREQFCSTVYTLVDRATSYEKVNLTSNLVIARTEKKIDDETFFRMMHIVDKLSWYELHCCYLKHCRVTEMDELDRKKSGSSDGDYLELIMSSNGLLQVDQEIKADTRHRTWDGGNENFKLTKKKDLTMFGRKFLSYGFKNFKYDIFGTLNTQ